MEEKKILTIEYINSISEYFDSIGYPIDINTKEKILNKYTNSNLTFEEIKIEIDKLVKQKLEDIKREELLLAQKVVNIEDYQNDLLQVKSIDVNGQTVTNNTRVELLGKMDIGYSGPKYVKFNNRTGFYKNSFNLDASLDNFEYIICQIGKWLEVKMAETYKLYKDNLKLGIISENVAKDNEKLYMTSDIPKLLKSVSPELEYQIQSLNRIKESSIQNGSVVRVSEKDDGVSEVPLVNSDEEIKIVINSFLTIIKEINVSKEEYREIRGDYFKMIMLDFIVNNVDRNKNNYGILISDDVKVRFAPLFDNSTVKIPSIPDGLQQLNGFFINKSNLLECLFTNYYEDIKEVTERCFYQGRELMNQVNKLCSEELTSGEREWFLNDTFIKYYSMVYDKQRIIEQKKIEQFSSYTDAYEQRQESTDNKKENNVITREKRKVRTLVKTTNHSNMDNSSDGFVNIPILTLIIFLVCTLGVFIGYMLYK